MFKKIFGRTRPPTAPAEPPVAETVIPDSEAETVVWRAAPATFVLGARPDITANANPFDIATQVMNVDHDWDDKTTVLGSAPVRPQGTPLPSGTIFNNRYEIIKPIGRGGFSYVYLCQHRRNGRLVAVKEAFAADALRSGTRVEVMDPQQSNIARAAMLQEVSAMSRITHPGIVSFEDVFEQNNTLCFAMDFIEGESLASLLSRRGALSLETLTTTTESLLDAVAALHENDLMHGDIKPGNIFVRPDKSIALIDFGTAARLCDVDYPSAIVSIGYSPPERYDIDARLGAWSDVYSCAATIASAATGERPPDATNTVAMAQYANSISARLPPIWARGLESGLGHDVQTRAASIADLRATMQISGSTPSVTPPDAKPRDSVFVSYAHKDADRVEAYVREVQRNGVSVWIDREGIAPGSPAWGAEIVKGMRGAERCLVFCSQHSMVSEAVKDEIYLAKELGKPIMVARLDDTPFNDEVLMFLTRSQHIPVVDADPAAFAISIVNVLNAEDRIAA